MNTKSSTNFCKIYLTRHGRTDWNENKITQGQSESNISETGIAQAKETAEKLKNVEFDAIYCSDLSMAFKTADIIRLHRNIEIIKMKSLRGRSYGKFEGQPIEFYKNALKDQIDARESLSEHEYISYRIAPDIETDGEIMNRVMEEFKKIANKHLNRSVLVVTHGGCIKNFLIKIGYTDRKSFPEGVFKHGNSMEILSDGENFYVK